LNFIPLKNFLEFYEFRFSNFLDVFFADLVFELDHYRVARISSEEKRLRKMQILKLDNLENRLLRQSFLWKLKF